MVPGYVPILDACCCRLERSFGLILCSNQAACCLDFFWPADAVVTSSWSPVWHGGTCLERPAFSLMMCRLGTSAWLVFTQMTPEPMSLGRFHVSRLQYFLTRAAISIQDHDTLARTHMTDVPLSSAQDEHYVLESVSTSRPACNKRSLLAYCTRK